MNTCEEAMENLPNNKRQEFLTEQAIEVSLVEASARCALRRPPPVWTLAQHLVAVFEIHPHTW